MIYSAFRAGRIAALLVLLFTALCAVSWGTGFDVHGSGSSGGSSLGSSVLTAGPGATYSASNVVTIDSAHSRYTLVFTDAMTTNDTMDFGALYSAMSYPFLSSVYQFTNGSAGNKQAVALGTGGTAAIRASDQATKFAAAALSADDITLTVAGPVVTISADEVSGLASTVVKTHPAGSFSGHASVVDTPITVTTNASLQNAYNAGLSLLAAGATNVSILAAPGNTSLWKGSNALVHVTSLDKLPSEIYLCCHYINPENCLYIERSLDGVNWGNIESSGAFVYGDSTGSSVSVRDPSIMYYRGTWYIAHTNILNTDGTCDIITSTDLVHWTKLLSITIGDTCLKDVWAPEWFVDGAGLPHIVATANTGSGSYVLYERHPKSKLASTWGTDSNWSARVVLNGAGTGCKISLASSATTVTGSSTIPTAGTGYTNGDILTVLGGGTSDAIITVSGVNGSGGVTSFTIVDSGAGYTASATNLETTSLTGYIDPFIIYHNGVYNLWAKYQYGDPNLDHWTSTSLTSGYVLSDTGDWAGFGGNWEGPFVVPLADGRFRVYLSDLLNGGALKYADSRDDSMNSWDPTAFCSFGVNHGLGAESNHGSILRITDPGLIAQITGAGN
jgi:hypothetical protein